MKEIKLRKVKTGRLEKYFPTEYNSIFEHCCPQMLHNGNIDYYRPIFEAHGYNLFIPYTIEKDAEIIYRLDGLAFIRGEDGFYRTDGDSINKYPFSCLNDPYYFTSNKNEL